MDSNGTATTVHLCHLFCTRWAWCEQPSLPLLLRQSLGNRSASTVCYSGAFHKEIEIPFGEKKKSLYKEGGGELPLTMVTNRTDSR